MTVYEIEEIQDSEDDSVSVGASQFQAWRRSPARAPQLRQSTLLGLFHPVK